MSVNGDEIENSKVNFAQDYKDESVFSLKSEVIQMKPRI